ncbi:MAG: ABC transporter ATP-binding protein [Gammaproteobacteria bacterium]|nr:ABC transporter ATP-binding protein [Gammaproteobacteria bacterium]
MTDHADDAANRARARALPMFNEGVIPPERDRALASDDSGFLDVMRLLLRSWPYIRPQLLGHWWYPGPDGGVRPEVADLVSGEGYQFGYAPFLVGAVALLGPLSGWIPATMDWPMALLYVPAIAMVLSMCLMSLTGGRLQMIGTVGVLLSGIGINVAGGFFIEGMASTLFGVMVTVASIIGWTLQFRLTGGQIEFRARVGTHLVYFYAINFLQRGINLVVGLITADLLNQSLLQAEPLAPGLAQLLGVPELAAGNIDELTDDQRRELIWSYVFVVLASFGLQFPLRVFNPYYNMWIMQRINQDLRIALISRWHQLSLSYHSEHRTGDSIFRIYQDSAMVTAVVGHMIGMTLAMMSYYTCVVLVTILNPWLGLAAGVLVAPALLWAGWAMPRMRVRALVYREATSDVTSTIQESFSSIKLIKAFGTAGRAQQRLEADSVVAFNAAFRVKNLIAIVTIVMYTVAAVFMAGGTSFMAWWAYQGEPAWFVELLALVGLSFVVWNLASFSWTRDQFHESSGDIRKLLRDWMTAQDLGMGLRRVFDILDIEPDVMDRPDAKDFGGLSREIRFEKVSFAYEASRPVLSDVSFAAEPGSITAIIGPTGSGKSTLMALLLRLFDPDTGRVTIDGDDLRDYRIASLRAAIAIALQENVLFAMSVRDNIRYVAPAASEDQVRTAIRVAAMDDYVDGLPNGIDTVLSDRGGKLSTGQRQRLSIARAVVRDTPILVLDEPTAALDAATEHRVMQNLAGWAGGADGRDGRAIFLITHRISTIRRADNILYLDGGRIVESGSHDALMSLEGGRYRGFVEAESTLTDTSRSLTA